MEILKDFMGTLIRKATTGNPCKVATYGVYAGMSKYGKIYHKNDVGTLLDKLRSDSKILVGLPSYTSCRGDKPCIDCARTHADKLTRLLYHAEEWPKIKWKMMENCHLKLVVFPETVILGGRNLTGSGWEDTSMCLTDMASVGNYTRTFDSLWNRAVDITASNIADKIEAVC